MLIGLPSASRGVRSLLNFFPPAYLSVKLSKYSWKFSHTASSGLAELPSSSSAARRHAWQSPQRRSEAVRFSVAEVVESNNLKPKDQANTKRGISTRFV